MGVVLVLALGCRWLGWGASKRNNAYFSSFSNELQKIMALDAKLPSEQKLHDVEAYLGQLLEKVREKLPTRAVRHRQGRLAKLVGLRMKAQNVVSMRDFVSGERSLYHSIRSEAGSFKSQFPPNFTDLTERILDRDDGWTKMLGLLPIGPISRMLDVLPGLFVVLGIFGTFIGICMALPEIAKIDFQNLEKSGEILTRFVLGVSFSMETSIAGIICSLVMTLLNTIAPVRGMRQQTFKMVENCFENLWLSLHDDQSFEGLMKKSLPELIHEVQEIKKRLDAGNRKSDQKGA